MSERKIRIAVSGAAGRMGNRIITMAGEQPNRFQVVAAIEQAQSPHIGHDSGTLGLGRPNGVVIGTYPGDAVEVMIDFSAPAGTRALVKYCVEHGIGMVIGTTGLGTEDQKILDNAARSIAILQATNTSLGVNLLLGMAGQMARQLGPAYDIEVIEAHHNQKKDAPSGTAISLVESICAATGRHYDAAVVNGRAGLDAQRQPGSIGVHSVRMGDVIGEHTIYFATGGERMEIKHVATTRDTFVRGALRAAEFIAEQKAGRYTMANVLGL